MALDKRFEFLLWLGKKRGRAFHPGITVAALRAGYAQANRQFGLSDPGGMSVRELTIPAGDGAALRARLYRRVDADGEMLPVLLYFHGGGWVIGDIDAYDGLTRYVAHGRISRIWLSSRQLTPKGTDACFRWHCFRHQHNAAR